MFIAQGERKLLHSVRSGMSFDLECNLLREALDQYRTPKGVHTWDSFFVYKHYTPGGVETGTFLRHWRD